jgi:hypothetical protein
MVDRPVSAKTGHSSSRKGDAVPDQNQNDLRPLRLEEDSLVRALLRQATSGEQLLRQLERAEVRDMDNGRMGSLEFAGGENRSLGSCIVEAEYLDRDSVPVSIALSSDKNGLLYELDMWKVDFAPLQQYPDFKHVTIKT